MVQDLVTNSHVIIMKAGPYCGYELDEIIKIKQAEEAKIGKFFWGYGGVFCRPTTVIPFVSHALMNQARPLVFFSTTASEYDSPKAGQFSQYSTDEISWSQLPPEVLLVGNLLAPHFAIVARNLKKVTTELALSDYCSFRGFVPDPNKYLDEYYRYRVDKACGFYLPQDGRKHPIVSLDYACELTEPYCVYVR